MTIAVRKLHKEDEMMALHAGSSVFVKKQDLLSIYTDKPALYAARLTQLVFTDRVLRESRMSEDKNAESSLKILDADTLDSIICMTIFTHVFFNFSNISHFPSHYSACHSSLQEERFNKAKCSQDNPSPH